MVSTGQRSNSKHCGNLYCTGVTCLVDGLVKARSAMHGSMNYRSAVVFGKGEAVTGDAKEQVLDLFTEKLILGSNGEFRPHLAKELKATELIRIPLDEASCKVRTGDPIDDEEDISLTYWAGVIPLECVAGTPTPASDLPASVAVPEAMTSQVRIRYSPKNKRKIRRYGECYA